MARKIARFYKIVTVEKDGEDYRIHLDGRALKTPGRMPLALPTRSLAEVVGEEWSTQKKTIEDESMPLTRLAFAAIDTVGPNRTRIRDEIAGYGRTDLLCYRAEAPDDLVKRQDNRWDPLLAWAAERFGARLKAGQGIVFIDQPAGSLSALADAVSEYDDFALAALHGAATITGSLVLALALAQGRLDAREAFALSRLDEAFQSEAWGIDAEAEARSRRLEAELEAIERFLRLARP